ncbi:MAG: S8 family serine peptidase, partial [Candidatus Sifarchaeia archaeon]
MKKSMMGTLLAILLVLPIIPLIPYNFDVDEASNELVEREIDYQALTETFGDEIPVVVQFSKFAQIGIVESLGVRFSAGSPDKSHIGDYYLMKGTPEALETLDSMGYFDTVQLQTPARNLHSPRNVSIPEVDADSVWNILDGIGRNVTGEGILIADLDSGVDWRHPDLWFADGESYDWLDAGADSLFVNGTDVVDLNRDMGPTADETLYYIDIDLDSAFDTSTEWIWADNVTQDGIPQIGEPFFVVNDTNHNDRIDVGEQLVMLNTPKTKYIVEVSSILAQTVVYERGVNLTTSPHEDYYGHGTAVAGILLGGQIGYRTHVGVAPNAELAMIRVLGNQSDWLTVEDGLNYAVQLGANVILTELGSWTYNYLDGSSAAETLIDTIVNTYEIPVISPSGNMGGNDKHALMHVPPLVPHNLDFTIPNDTPGQEYRDMTVYITVLSVNDTDFTTCNFTLTLQHAGGPGIIPITNPGIGHLNFAPEPPYGWSAGVIQVESFISTSGRGTKMLGIWISGTLPVTTGAPWHQLTLQPPASTEFHAFISDSHSSWSGGAVWKSDVWDAYHITWPSTADSALSVASYHTRSLWGVPIGSIASYSSIGPRITEDAKQTVAAPGGWDVISTYTDQSDWADWYSGPIGNKLPLRPVFGGYQLFSGTSAAGPHVAGAAALILQVNATAGKAVRQMIESTARVDSDTGGVHNPTWGWGKLNVSAAIESAMQDTSGPFIGTPVHHPSAPLDTDTVDVGVIVTDLSDVDTVILTYHNGTHWNNITMNWNGTHYEATIPALPLDTTVTYRVMANDTLDNWSVSGDTVYVVGSSITTPTVTTTTTTTTTTPVLPEEPDYLMIALMLGIIMLLIVFSIALSRRR